MEEKFNKIREVLAIFGEKAFYSITISPWDIKFQGDITRDSIRIAEDAGFIKEKGTIIQYKKDNNHVIFM